MFKKDGIEYMTEWKDLEGGFMTLPRKIMKAKSICLLDKLILSRLIDRANMQAEGHSWPSHASLADDFGLERKTIKKSISRLREKKLIMVASQYKGRSNGYLIPLNEIKKLCGTQIELAPPPEPKLPSADRLFRMVQEWIASKPSDSARADAKKGLQALLQYEGQLKVEHIQQMLKMHGRKTVLEFKRLFRIDLLGL